jgi:hypothetical protein
MATITPSCYAWTDYFSTGGFESGQCSFFGDSHAISQGEEAAQPFCSSESPHGLLLTASVPLPQLWAGSLWW